MTKKMRDVFAYIQWSEIESVAPYLCGECDYCTAAGCWEQRVDEYVANLEDGEMPTAKAAIKWLRNAYPACPIGTVITAAIREMVVEAAFSTPGYAVTYAPPWRGHTAELTVNIHAPRAPDADDRDELVDGWIF